MSANGTAPPPIGVSLECEPLGSYTKHTFEDAYELISRLNSGGYGTVFTTHYNGDKDNKENKSVYAVKVLDRTSPRHKDDAVINEVQLLKELRNIDGVIKLLDFYVSPEKMYVVQVCASGGDVFDRLSARSTYTEYDAKNLAKILLTTCSHMHKLKIVHRDLKPENLLLNDKTNDTAILLCDFGFAKKLPQSADGEDGYLTSRCGTPDFVAPEILMCKKYQEEIDLWSIGCILFLLLCGYTPFQGRSQKELFKKIKAGDYVFHEKFWGNVSVEGKKCISSLLMVKKEQRWTAQQALDCEWIKDSPALNDSLRSNELGLALKEFKKYKLRAAFQAVRWAASAKFWKADMTTFSTATTASKAKKPKKVSRASIYQEKQSAIQSQINNHLKDDDDVHHEEAVNEEEEEEDDEATDMDAAAKKSPMKVKNRRRSSVQAVALQRLSFYDVYLLESKIQSGNYSTVYMCTHKVTKEQFACKVIKRKKRISHNQYSNDSLSSESDEIVFNEVSIMQSLSQYDQYIVPLVDFYEDKNYFFLVMEYMSGGDVFDRIVSMNKYTEKDARDLIKVLLNAVKILHSHNIAHHDLKPQNLMLESNTDNARIKLVDFGFAKRVHEPQSLTSRLGTPTYVAPEILKNIPHDQRVDLWSVGVITYVLLVGYPPFMEDTPQGNFAKIRTGTFEFHEEDWDSISTDAKDFVCGLMKVNPMDRWSIDECLRSPWIVQSDFTLSSRDLDSSLVKLRERKNRLRTIVKSVVELQKMKNLAISNKKGNNDDNDVANNEEFEKSYRHHEEGDTCHSNSASSADLQFSDDDEESVSD